MSIPNLDEDRFKAVLKEQLSASKAITSPAHLRGRAQKLEQIERAFNAPGRHIFIFGDRGVGKTSLAQTAAFLHQSSDNSPITVGCDSQATFFSVAKDIAMRCLPTHEILRQKKKTETLKVSLPFFSYDTQNGQEAATIGNVASINEAISLLKAAGELHSSTPVIVIDEFDQISSDEEKKRFADFIKQASDQDLNMKFIFCGIGSSLDDLLGVHLSTTRYLAAIELDRLPHDARWEIITGAAHALGVTVEHETKVRIGTISDGFPYYVHLLSEMLFWQLFNDPANFTTNTIAHFETAIHNAVLDIAPFLKKTYEKATQKYGDDYQEVLWAVADSPLLSRPTAQIYESYVVIMGQLTRPALDKSKFYTRMNNLKSDRHGSILKATRSGWYSFSENIVRGYVRLIAEQSGVQLEGDHLLSPRRGARA